MATTPARTLDLSVDYPQTVLAAQAAEDPSAREHRRAKERGILLASGGLVLALAVLISLDVLGLAAVRGDQWLIAVVVTAAVQGFLWLIPHRGWDRFLPWDRHYLYIPMLAASLLLMLYIAVAPAGRILLLMAWFTALMFMVGRVGFAGVAVLSSVMAAGYVTVSSVVLSRLHLAAAGRSTILFEGTVAAVFMIINLYAGIVFERLRRERDERRALQEEQKRSKDRIERQLHRLAALRLSLQSSNEDLRQAYDLTIEGWSRALELRDRETQGHTTRVAELTVRLAQALQMQAEDLEHVRRGALLHDIGKMGIPDSILLKPGALTPEEWEIMRQHPARAHDLLNPIAFLRPALEIPYSHHEKWDGTGYPRGLQGDAIPLAARIFAAVDVWDALRSARPYREPWSAERTRAYILSQSGSHFDPQVVQAFLTLDLS